MSVQYTIIANVSQLVSHCFPPRCIPQSPGLSFYCKQDSGQQNYELTLSHSQLLSELHKAVMDACGLDKTNCDLRIVRYLALLSCILSVLVTNNISYYPCCRLTMAKIWPRQMHLQFSSPG